MTRPCRDVLVTITYGLIAVAVACTSTHDRPRAKGCPAARLAAPRIVTAEQACIASADSALSVYLSDQRFRDTARVTSAFEVCDTGGDNATLLVAIGLSRVIGHSAVAVDSTPDDGAGPARTVGVTLELHSVAHFIPTWTLDANGLQGLRETPSESEPYVARVGARVDTATIVITQNIARPTRWSVCDLTHTGDANTPFWNFANGRMRDIAVLRWEPPASSWADVSRLADSVSAAR